jgi:hypothetical protein
MSIAGLVIYEIRLDGSLVGRWTHPRLQGKMATERAWGGTPGKLEGSYDVEVYTDDGRRLFVGSLKVQPIGQAYTLTWSGAQLLPQRSEVTFTGIGVVANPQMLVATFQQQ